MVILPVHRLIRRATAPTYSTAPERRKAEQTCLSVRGLSVKLLFAPQRRPRIPMTEPSDLPEPETAPRAPERPRTPPTRLPWPFTILLLLLLPALVIGVWLGGAFHKVDDRPVPTSRRPTPGYVPKKVAPATPPAKGSVPIVPVLEPPPAPATALPRQQPVPIRIR